MLELIIGSDIKPINFIHQGPPYLPGPMGIYNYNADDPFTDFIQ